VVYDVNNAIIKDAKTANKGDKIRIKMSSGSLAAKVDGIEE